MDNSGLIPPAGSVKWCAGIPEVGVRAIAAV